MENYLELAQKFTDFEYLAKNQIRNIVGSNLIDEVWRTTIGYREQFRNPIALKRHDYVPFSICITPAINEYTKACEDYMDKFLGKFVKLSELNNPYFVKIKKDILLDDFYEIGRHYKFNIRRENIAIIMNSVAGSDNSLHDIISAYKFVITSNDIISKDFIFKIEQYLDPNFNNNYRNLTSGLTPVTRIEDYLDYVIKLSTNKSNFSPFVIASLISFVFEYVQPFEKYSNILGLLVAIKYLKDHKYGESSIYTSLVKSYLSMNMQIKETINNSINYGDLTYYMISFMQAFLTGLDENYDTLGSIKVTRKPTPIGPDDEAIKIDLNRNILESEKELEETFEETSSDAYAKKEFVKQEVERQEFDFVENDPFAKPVESTPVEEVLSEPIINEEQTVIVEEIIENPIAEPIAEEEPKTVEPLEKVEEEVVIKQEPIIEEEPIVEPVIVDNRTLYEKIKHYVDIDPNDLVRMMLKLEPRLRKHQAYFFAYHHENNAIYTIQDFKKYASLSYETCRTSLDLMSQLGLYKKEQYKNKWVYIFKDER